MAWFEPISGGGGLMRQGYGPQCPLCGTPLVPNSSAGGPDEVYGIRMYYCPHCRRTVAENELSGDTRYSNRETWNNADALRDVGIGWVADPTDPFAEVADIEW